MTRDMVLRMKCAYVALSPMLTGNYWPVLAVDKHGIYEWLRTLAVTLPRTNALTPLRPCEAMAIKSQLLGNGSINDG